MEKAIEYIETNLKERIALDDVAKEACLSKYHFHRVFSSVVGETLGDYIRKRRLTEASRRLIERKAKASEIAYEYQFETQQSFSRSFKNHFGISPGLYRKQSLCRFMYERKKITKQRLKHLGEITMKPVIKQIEEMKIVGMEKTTTLNTSYIDIPKLWENFCSRMHEINNVADKKTFYEVRKPDMNFSMDDFKETSEFTEIAGLEVTTVDTMPEGMINVTIPAGKYAVFTHKGSPINLRQTYEYIWGTWLPNSGYEADLRFDFELYGERFKGAEDPESEVDIHIPIK
jgi:AraC family transcriptional regulator